MTGFICAKIIFDPTLLSRLLALLSLRQYSSYTYTYTSYTSYTSYTYLLDEDTFIESSLKFYSR